VKWFGITGGLGSGKSTVLDILKSLGYSTVSADELARLVVSPGSDGLKTVVQEFGNEILAHDKSLDRKKLGALVFKDAKKLSRLEAILHPLIQAEAKKYRKKFESDGQAFAFYEIPLLFEKDLAKQFDAVIVVSSSKDSQLKRVINRDKLSVEAIDDRLKSQLSMNEKVKKADFVIKNDGTLDELKKQVEACMDWIKNNK
jgi:dephospho-CoA kinase